MDKKKDTKKGDDIFNFKNSSQGSRQITQKSRFLFD